MTNNVENLPIPTPDELLEVMTARLLEAMIGTEAAEAVWTEHIGGKDKHVPCAGHFLAEFSQNFLPQLIYGVCSLTSECACTEVGP